MADDRTVLPNTSAAPENEKRAPESADASRREFVTKAAAAAGGIAGLGALIGLAEEAAAQQRTLPDAVEQPIDANRARLAWPQLHNRPLDQETRLAVQQMGMELVAYAYGIEAVGANARGFLSIFRCGRTKNGTTCRTCCHPDHTFSPGVPYGVGAARR